MPDRFGAARSEALPRSGGKGALGLLRDLVGGLTGGEMKEEDARIVAAEDKPAAAMDFDDVADFEAEEEVDGFATLAEGAPLFSEAPETAAAPPPPAPRQVVPQRQQERERSAASTNPASELARTQEADGSFGGDVARTVAALLTLILLGHTRRTGSRRRTVAKAADWLAKQSDPIAKLALTALAEAERGSTPSPTEDWSALYAAGDEGQALRAAVG